MPAHKNPQDEDSQRFEFLPGTKGFPNWGGVVTEGSPDNIGPNRLRKAYNVRIKNGIIQGRPGNVKADTTQLGDAVRWVHEQPIRPIRLWFGMNGCVGGLGGSLTTYDPEQNPDLQLFGRYRNSSDQGVTLALFGGDIFIGEGPNLRKLQLFHTDYGYTAGDLGGASDTLLHSFTGHIIQAMKEFDNKLFILLVDIAGGGTAGKISVWDGISIQDDLTGIGVPTAACLARDNLVVGFTSAANHIRTRVAGAVPGTWSTVAPGAGTVSTYNSSTAMIEYRDAVYIASGGTDLWKYDWTTLASIRTVTSATEVKAVAVGWDHLYYGYITLTAALIGKYDAESNAFTDALKSLTAQFANDTVINTLVYYRERLIAGMKGVTTSGTNYIPKVFMSPGADISNSTWLGTTSSSPPAGTNGAVNMLVA